MQVDGKKVLNYFFLITIIIWTSDQAFLDFHISSNTK